MKIIEFLIGFCIIFGIQGLSAQSKISIGINYSLANNSRLISSYNSDNYKEYRDDNESSSLGTEFGVDLRFRIDRNWFLKSGLGLAQRGYETDEDRIIDPCYSPITCGFESEIYRYRYDFIKMPLQIVYQTSKQLNFSFVFGSNVLIPLSNEVEWVLRKEYGKWVDQKITKENSEISNKFNLTLNLGLGIGYRLSERINMIISPTFDYNILAHENKDIRDRLYGIGRFVDEDKSTKENLISYGIGFNLIYNFRNSTTE